MNCFKCKEQAHLRLTVNNGRDRRELIVCDVDVLPAMQSYLQRGYETKVEELQTVPLGRKRRTRHA